MNENQNQCHRTLVVPKIAWAACVCAVYVVSKDNKNLLLLLQSSDNQSNGLVAESIE